MSATAFPPSGPAPWSVSRDLPPYRGILAVDAKDFTGRPAVEHVTLTTTIPQLLHQALERAGLEQLWRDQRFANNTGDGFVFGFDPVALPRVIHPFLNELQELLTDYNIHATATGRLRLRVSLHVGPLPDSGAPGDGNGTPRNDTHRLLDSTPVKAILAASSESITQVAAIVSQRVFEDAVLSGYTRLHPDRFIEVPATVEGKNFQQRAWLFVPAPSGNLYDRRILGDGAGSEGPAQPERAPAPPAEPAPAPAVTNNYGFLSNAKTVRGGQHQHVHGSDSGQGGTA
ncbi:hypothetical protein FHS39_002206 [Streptomyces olivoverticillatus]|uniref:Guanylate cyclase domain-containing protein n=1 Tax=Streptomyces olivoverticillatus TaxID=66427 RepID=A0A7W7LMY0_9ACTN|nr:hypothetical protein [Streptomyces olivoverticillatus]MBB4893175.1 hypothetical protein [Streptomyces olivoverticillatus]